MLIGYKKLFWENLLYKKEYLINFFEALKKLNLEIEKILNKISKDLKIFYYEIENKFKEKKINETKIKDL